MSRYYQPEIYTASRKKIIEMSRSMLVYAVRRVPENVLFYRKKRSVPEYHLILHGDACVFRVSDDANRCPFSLNTPSRPRCRRG